MLSPASLRVCCLAVMAPALSKADRRADFFPDVLSRPFCVSKTADILNGEDKITRYSLTNLVSKSACSSNRRRTISKQCTYVNYGPGFNAKTRYIPHKCHLRIVGVRTNAEAQNKAWQSTNATTALAGKIKSKYTMSKNTSPVKNMGLAKATTSLGLQNLKMKRINQLPHSNKENESVPYSDNGEGSPDLPDSTNSELEAALLIAEIKPSVSESAAETDVSSTANDSEVPTSVSKNEICDASDRNVSTTITMEELSVPYTSNCSIPDHASSDTLVSQLELKESPLPVTETRSLQTSKCVESSDSSELCGLNSSSLALTSCSVPVLNDTNVSMLPVESGSACVSSFKNESYYGSNDGEIEFPNCSVADLPSLSEMNFVMPLVGKETINDSFNVFSDIQLSAVTSEPPDCEVDTNLVLSSISVSHLVSDVSESTSDHSDFVTSAVTCEEPLGEVEKLCCLLSLQELNSLGNLLSEKEEKIYSSLNQSQLLLRKHMNAHAKQQIRNFIDYYQEKLNIPCQRPAKNVVKPGKELVDMKAELLQSEDVKNLSTAALVSLVRKLESSGSPGKLLSQQKVAPVSELQSSEKQNLTFDPEDVADIKHTSGVLLNTMRNLLKSVDPYLTESSDEEIESDVEEEDITDSSSDVRKRALWKYLTKRAALASRSTWLLARIHELEYQIRGYNDRLKELSAAEGEVCLEEAVASQSSTLSIAGSDNVNLEVSVKQTALKNLIKPMNGYLDHTHVSEAVVQTTTSLSSSSQREQEVEKTSVLDTDGSCCRTRPLNVSSFRKRKLMHTTGLHLVSSKFARLSTISCYCNSLNVMHPCVLCTGRYNSVQSVDPDSMLVRERIALLDPYFHPVLSLEKDIPLALHFENLLKKNAAQFQNLQPPSPVGSHRRLRLGAKPKRFSDMRNHSRKLNRFTRSLLSAKYRNKHIRNSKHLRKHRLVFGKWRRLHNKNTFHDRDRIRRLSFASSASSHDSPVPSPVSVFDDGMGYDHKKRRDDNQFDIDDVIIPCNSKSGRLVEIQYKEIVIPSWRYRDVKDSEVVEMEDVEDISDSTFVRRHDRLEIEEKKMLRSTALGLSAMNRRGRRNRCDSRADSSGANTPDPVLLYNQDIMFQVPHSIAAGDPSSPALSPPTTPSSATVVSDDSQPSFGNGSLARFERRKFMIQKRPLEESTIGSRCAMNDYDEIPPYERRVFPLSDKDYEELLAETILYKEEVDVSPSGPSCPASPESSSSSTSTVEEEDIMDPEWTVVKRDTGPEQALVLKFAKR